MEVLSAAEEEARARAAARAKAEEAQKKHERECEELRIKKMDAKHQAKGQSCKSIVIPKCHYENFCQEFLRRANKLQKAADARSEYDKRCFEGGDKRHNEQIDGLKNAVRNCNKKYDKCMRTVKK